MVHTGVRHSERIQSAIQSDHAARSALVASWSRSASLHRLDPSQQLGPNRLTRSGLDEAKARMEPLLHAAQATLDRLYLAVGGVGCCVLLADRSGVLVDRRGAAADDSTFDEWGLWDGAVWSEQFEGTNGIGTCLVEERTLTVHADQHFLDRNTALSCTTAPVYDQEGNLAAALDVSSCRADLTGAFAHLISVATSDAARRIETDHFHLSFPKARIVMAPSCDRTVNSLVAVDPDDLVIGATRAARQSLGLTSEIIRKGISAADLLRCGEPADSELLDAERAVLQRALARSGGKVAAAARILGISRATLHRKLNRLNIRRLV